VYLIFVPGDAGITLRVW